MAGPDAAPPKSVAIPVREKSIFALGGAVSGFSLNAPNYLANPILNLTLGLNPVLIGVVIAIARLWDGLMDPLFGHLSDNTRTRWGRRKPYMLAASLLVGVSFAAMWWLPRDASHTFYFCWFLVTTLLFYTSCSMFLVPWSALGIEMTGDYHERTRLNAFVGAAHKAIGMGYAWLYPLAQLAIFQDTLEGARYVGLGCGILLSVACFTVALGIKERPAPVVKRVREPMIKALKVVCSNPIFLRLSAASVLTMTSLMTVSSLALYINIYHVYGGDKVAAAKMAAVFGMVFNIIAIAAIPCVTWLSRRYGKHGAVMICLGMICVSAFLKFFAYTPSAPWAQLLIPLLHAPGLSAYYVILNSMTADLVDYDELRTGQRREALLGAANQWLTKMGMSLSYISSGLILNLTGFDAELTTQSPETVMGMRLAFCAVPIIGTGLALIMMRNYPLDQKKLEEVQAELREGYGRRESR